MAQTLTPEEAVARAERAQAQRLDAIRTLAHARQAVTDVREQTERERAELEARIAEQIGAAERDDVKAYNAAVTAGWTDVELRKIGFAEPEKKARTRRRAARKETPSVPATAESNQDGQ
jgi:hypothetical protein